MNQEAENLDQLPARQRGLVHIEFVTSHSKYTATDRKWVTKKGADQLCDTIGVARRVTDSELIARREGDDQDAEELNYLMEYAESNPGTPYQPGDCRWVNEEEKARLEKNRIAKCIEVSADYDPTSKSDPDERERIRKQARQDELAEHSWDKLWSLASKVSSRTGDDPDDRQSDTLRAFLLDRWADYQAAKADTGGS